MPIPLPVYFVGGPAANQPKVPVPPAAAPKPAPDVRANGKYTAVIYFHGMGSQRRHEEVCQVIDALDSHSRIRHAADPSELLMGIEVRLEKSREADSPDISFIKADFRIGKGDDKHWSHVRFYEAYWAPVTAGGVSVSKVAIWLVQRIPNPLRTLRTPWRLMQRLRRSYLRRLGSPTTDDYVVTLLGLYDDFEGLDARRRFSKGTFREFLTYLEQQLAAKGRWKDKPKDRAKILSLARTWGWHYLLGECRIACVLITFALTIALAGGSLLLLAYAILALLNSGTSLKQLEPTWENVLTAVGGFLSLVGVYGFLQHYLGDVLLWSTYQETDENYKKREEILQSGAAMMRHVLRDEACERVIVVAHSLGTCVALDGLLELGRYNWARSPRSPLRGGDEGLRLDKLDILITMGSPIDKIHYFFESNAGGSHRYNRVSEKIRSDMDSVPFATNRKPHIHWINVWDEADIISGPLETPTSRKYTYIEIDNHQVASLYCPLPRTSHNAYFENASVIKIIYEAIFQRRRSYASLVHGPESAYNYRDCFVGVGTGLFYIRWLQRLVLLIPWFVFALGILVFLEHLSLRSSLLIVAIPLAIVAISWLVHVVRGTRSPLHAEIEPAKKHRKK